MGKCFCLLCLEFRSRLDLCVLQADSKFRKQQRKKPFKFNTEREKALLAEVINFNPFQYEHEGHAWAEFAILEEGVEISGCCARDKANLMLHQFHVED